MKKYNFSAGPSKLDKTVIEKANQSIIEYEDKGLSILEISHRSKEYTDIMEKLKSNLKNLFAIPENYFILFLQGGATYQNSLIPHNFGNKSNIGCLVTGEWSKKTLQDFELINKTESTSVSHEEIEKFLINDNSDAFKDLDHLHLTSNETINGIQIRDFNNINHPSLFIDMSSDFGSYNFEWENISYIYSGAQKNMGIPGVTICIGKNEVLNNTANPSYLDLKKLVENDSVYNTPPTFSIYVLYLVTEWMLHCGGIKYFEEKSISSSELIYSQIEQYGKHIILPVSEYARSRSNVVFNFNDPSIEKDFFKKAEEENILGIKGHRSVGGVRISLYNAINDEMIDYLNKFISRFFEKI